MLDTEQETKGQKQVLFLTLETVSIVNARWTSILQRFFT
jgi:hypothetical protein